MIEYSGSRDLNEYVKLKLKQTFEEGLMTGIEKAAEIAYLYVVQEYKNASSVVVAESFRTVAAEIHKSILQFKDEYKNVDNSREKSKIES